MAKRKLYHIEIKERGQDEALPWYRPIEAQYTSMQYARGYLSCIKSYYPAPRARIIENETSKIIEEFGGNGVVRAVGVDIEGDSRNKKGTESEAENQKSDQSSD